MSGVPSVEDVQKLLSRGPFHQWLGLKVIAVSEGTIEACRKSAANSPALADSAKLRQQLVQDYRRAAAALRSTR